MKRFLIFLAGMALLAACEKPTGAEQQNTLSVSPKSLSFQTAGESKLSLTVSSNIRWTATVANGGSWCSLSAYTGEGNATLDVTAVTNLTDQPRTTEITFAASGCSPVSVSVSQVAGEAQDKTVTQTLTAEDLSWDGEKRANVTYQLNVYSFADSDGDGWGDLRGVTQHLDYFDELGVSALWLSPVQTSMSYHGYDVIDYNEINPKLGTEDDFRELIDMAKARGIKIYMDYVLNHTGNENPWFKAACVNPGSPYRNYYVFEDKPGESVTGGMGTWHTSSSGELGYHGLLHFKLDVSNASQPRLTVTQATGAAQSGNTDTSVKWFIYDNNAIRMYKTGTNLYEITLAIDNDWGVLVKDDATQWDNHKWGARADDKLVEFGTPKTLVKGSAANDLIFGGTSVQYYASFDASMPDLYYGPAASAATSPAFKALVASVDKWIQLGVAGLRLDAVIWIYQKNTTANVAFLKQWYDSCNTLWKANGGQGDFYMVAEAWCDNAEEMAPYYEGLPSNFNFYYWYTLKDRIGKGKGDDFATTLVSFQKQFRKYRSDFIDAIKLSNHDEDRAAEDLGRSLAKEKLAAAVLLTSPGKPYIYQGEELGYWGSKGKGDEYVRTPIKWTRSGAVPSAPLSGKVDNNMLSAEISVEAQNENEASLLRLYQCFSQLRNEYKALAGGEMTPVNTSSVALSAWTVTSDGQTALVVHNFSGSKAAASFGTQDLSRCVALTGTATLKTTSRGDVVSDRVLTLDPYSSAVFILHN